MTKQRAIFLDRDGVINIERGEYTYKMEDFCFPEGMFEALAEFQKQGFLLIVITNQGGIGRGVYTHEDVKRVHDYFFEEAAKRNITITDLFYCPHHPVKSRCLCRKPESLMLEKAIAKWNVDAANSWFIGDSARDIEAAIKCGVKPIKVASNENLNRILKSIVGGQ